MKVLLNYEFVPESNKVYLLDLEGDELNAVKLLQDSYINLTAMTTKQGEAADWLAKYLEDQLCVFDSEEQHDDPDADYSVPISGAEIFIQTGFCL